MKENTKEIIKAVAQIEDVLDSVPISAKLGGKIGLLAGFSGNPILIGTIAGVGVAYGVSKVAQKVVEKKGW